MPCYHNGMGFILDMLLLEMGWHSLSGLLLSTHYYFSAYSNYLWMHEQTGEVRSFIELLDQIVEAVLRFADWHQDGLVTTSYVRSWENPAANHPVIICQFGDLTSEILSNYTLQVIPGTFRDSKLILSAAIAAPDTDVREFFRFLDWMDSDALNYAEFRYGLGEENGNEPSYADWFFENFRFFVREDLKFEVEKATNHPILKITGYPEEILQMPLPKYPLDESQAFEILEMLFMEGVSPMLWGERFNISFALASYFTPDMASARTYTAENTREFLFNAFNERFTHPTRGNLDLQRVEYLIRTAIEIGGE
jgi:hypothetical protein